MSTGSRGGGGAVEIPASTKKVVQDLKEVVGNSEEEIYAMLKECNMDPNETAQRLLNQDPFHEVKRKRDKKKDSGGLKEVADVRGRPGSTGNYGKGGGRGGGGRGSSLPRFGSQEHGGGRGRSSGRENGIHLSSRGSSAVSNSSPVIGVAKPSSAVPTSVPSSAPAQLAVAPQAQGPSSGSASFSGVANGSSSEYVRPAAVPQGAWASGHGTMADLLKARAAPPPSFQAPSASPAFPSAQPTASPSYPAAGSSVPSSEASEFYSSSADPVLDSSVDSHGGGAQGAIGTVGNQRPIGLGTSSVEASLGSDVEASSEPSSVAGAAERRDVETEVEVPVERPSSPPPVISPASSPDVSVEEAISSPEGQQSGGLSALGGSQFNGRPSYALPQQPVGTQKGPPGVGLEWKAKAPGPSSGGLASDGGSQSMGAVDPTMLVQSYQSLSLQDNEPVIIPTHFRVPEADLSHLSFGSFGADFNAGFGTSIGLQELEKLKHEEAVAAEEAPLEHAAPASVETQVEMGQSYGHQHASTAVENKNGNLATPPMVHTAPVSSAEEQHSKADAVVQQSPAYFLGASNYPGFGLMPQMPGGQYGYEQAESQGQDASRIPSMMPTYDPTTSYYTSAFRGADADRLYPPYVPTNTSSKYSGGNIGLITAPSLPSSQEGVNPIIVSSGPSAAPSLQAGSNVQSAQAIPQQALPMHYTQPHSVQYGGNYVGYQYMPQNYPYLQPPYPHHIYNSSNSAYAQPPAGSSYAQPPAGSSYAQPPAGSSYPPTAGSSYPSGGATAVKFPMAQYKPVAGAGNAPQSAPGIGYGGYTATPAGYASNPAVTTGNASGYEDVSTSHYKDSTLYIPNQQPGDSSPVWIQTPLPRDMGPSGGMQTSSYYNLPSQGQHSGYGHSQQPSHGHAHPNAGYGNLYHPSQAAPAASHQMLQQPQGMGGGGGNTQAGGYQQQPQRSQQTWSNSNY